MVRCGFVARPGIALSLAVFALGSAATFPSPAGAYKVPKPCVVPNVVAKSLRTAERQIKRAHCQVGTVTSQTSLVHKNHVLSQDPAVGAAGPTVNLVVSSGPPPKGCTVPDVVGKLLSTAERRIARAHCQIGNVTSQSSTVRRGRVISQDPAAGAAGPSVNLIISSGTPRAPRCRVPDVVGERLAHARVRLRRAHCSVGKIVRRRSFRPRGRVIAQRPHRGERLPAGARVGLIVSAGRHGGGPNGQPRHHHKHHRRHHRRT